MLSRFLDGLDHDLVHLLWQDRSRPDQISILREMELCLFKRLDHLRSKAVPVLPSHTFQRAQLMPNRHNGSTVGAQFHRL